MNEYVGPSNDAASPVNQEVFFDDEQAANDRKLQQQQHAETTETILESLLTSGMLQCDLRTFR